MSLGYQLAKDYENRTLCGWLGVKYPELVKSEFDMLKARGAFLDFFIENQTEATDGTKTMLYDVTRKVLGKDTENYPQEIGDCVSFGAKNAAEYLQALDILLRGVSEKWRPVFPSYYYGTMRNYVGQNQIGSEDGGMGSWMAEAVQKYGTLFSDEQNVPKYSGLIAKRWGDSRASDDLDIWKPTAINYLVKGAAQIKNWADLVASIKNGYPCPTASDIGYNMEASSDGFHRQTTSWGHQMCFIGVDDNAKDPYAIILNNWGDVHGHLKDFDTGDNLPLGVLRVRRKDAEKHINAEETYAYSKMQGFPENKLDKALFFMG